jgi:uncharacterized circularly permuted ATP-grasp superfamily protein/uncharacterized alpha-E superfamily protein
MTEGAESGAFGAGQQAGETDLFGPGPESDPLAWYTPPDPASDLFASAPPEMHRAWRSLAQGFARAYPHDLAQLQAHVDRHVEDLGLGYRIAGDEHERPWPLNPMPILIGAGEWARVSEGLVQRAQLLERVIADLYGPQTLIAKGALPAAVVSGSPNFARRLVGATPRGGHYLHVYGVDLARGPSGEWRVLSDLVTFPVGIGYAIENRQALARSTGGLLAGLGARQHSGFFDALRRGIANHCQRDEPRMALLTPGRFNQYYSEQAHLARHLGFALVEGRDLTVREDRLYARTIAGLKRIDGLWRWITTRDLDPMNFDARSQIGVPGLVSAAAANSLVVTNWPGVGVVQSRAMPAFLPRLARAMLGEELVLPNAATWWCGGEKEREHVLAHLDQLVVSPAYQRAAPGFPDGRRRAGASLSDEERRIVTERLAVRPMDYVAQEIVKLSTTPVLAGGRLEARGFTLRAFLARDESGEWTVLDGGFARVFEQSAMRSTLMGLGDISTDVCILDETRAPGPEAVLETGEREVRRDQGLLPSQAADNLFWLGRYGERAHQTARVVRVLIDEVATRGQGGDPERETPAKGGAPSTLERLVALLRNLGAIAPPAPDLSQLDLAAQALGGEAQGSVRAIVEREQMIALLLRDRLSRDSWRALQRPAPDFLARDIESMASACDRLVERHATIAWLTTDSLARGPAWRFLDMGLRVERASMILQAAQAMIPGSASADDLSALLDIADGQSAYRSRYLSMPYIARVYDLILLDPAQPQGLAFQLERIERHLAAIPPLRDDGMPEAPLHAVRQLRARVEGTKAAAIGTMTIEALRQDVAELSQAISARFFLQTDTASAARAARRLG